MKAVLEFNLPEETTEHSDAINGAKWKFIVSQLDGWLRNKIKYDNIPFNDCLEALEKTREELRQLIDDDGLSLE